MLIIRVVISVSSKQATMDEHQAGAQVGVAFERALNKTAGARSVSAPEPVDRDPAAERLRVLAERMAPVVRDLPDSVDLFDTGFLPGPPPRYWVDMLSFVEMARDNLTYRFPSGQPFGANRDHRDCFDGCHDRCHHGLYRPAPAGAGAPDGGASPPAGTGCGTIIALCIALWPRPMPVWCSRNPQHGLRPCRRLSPIARKPCHCRRHKDGLSPHRMGRDACAAGMVGHAARLRFFPVTPLPLSSRFRRHRTGFPLALASSAWARRQKQRVLRLQRHSQPRLMPATVPAGGVSYRTGRPAVSGGYCDRCGHDRRLCPFGGAVGPSHHRRAGSVRSTAL